VGVFVDTEIGVALPTAPFIDTNGDDAEEDASGDETTTMPPCTAGV
jgi:hypothetical protein